MDSIRAIELLTASSATGLLFALTGTGGSSILTPIMTLLLGFSPTIAIPSDIVGSISMRATTSLLNIRLGRVAKGILTPLVVGQLCGLGISAAFLSGIHLSDAALNVILGFTLSLIGSALALKEFVNRTSEKEYRFTVTHLLLFIGGTVSALTVAFTSVGGGIVTYLVVAIAFPKLDPKSVIAVDATAGLILSILASIETIATGRGDVVVMALIAAGGLIGCVGGERIKEKISSHILKEAIAITISAIGIIYLVRSGALIPAIILGGGYLIVLTVQRKTIHRKRSGKDASDGVTIVSKSRHSDIR
ncbi:MAG: sulfite exporter TauE/SafE family protein [Actinomycetota bacterium]|nr:sulfite exporter TauE/SafE family protein [Actinomycetota bacterium]